MGAPYCGGLTHRTAKAFSFRQRTPRETESSRGGLGASLYTRTRVSYRAVESPTSRETTETTCSPSVNRSIGRLATTDRFTSAHGAAAELAVLKKRHALLLERYRKDPKAAAEVAKVGKYPQAAGLDPVEHAAWTGIANILLNLDETLTRE